MTQTYKERVSCAFSRHAVEDIADEADASIAELRMDLASAQGELRRIATDNAVHVASLASKDAEIARLRDQLTDWMKANGPGGWIDEQRQNSDRYLWLRSQPDDTEAPRIDVVHWQVEDESANSGTALRGEELDAAIDVARGESK